MTRVSSVSNVIESLLLLLHTEHCALCSVHTMSLCWLHYIQFRFLGNTFEKCVSFRFLIVLWFVGTRHICSACIFNIYIKDRKSNQCNGVSRVNGRRNADETKIHIHNALPRAIFRTETSRNENCLRFQSPFRQLFFVACRVLAACGRYTVKPFVVVEHTTCSTCGTHSNRMKDANVRMTKKWSIHQVKTKNTFKHKMHEWQFQGLVIGQWMGHQTQAVIFCTCRLHRLNTVMYADRNPPQRIHTYISHCTMSNGSGAFSSKYSKIYTDEN